MDDSKLLIVRHGPGRGTVKNFLTPAFNWMAETSPEFFERLRFHETGTGSPDLKGVAAVVFFLGGPLEERFPDCYFEAKAIDDWARLNGLPRLNPPDALANGRKSVQSRLWTQAGIPTPRGIRFSDRAELESAVEATGFPIVIRGDLMHSLMGLHFCRHAGEFESIVDSVVYPGLVTPFVDTRASYRVNRRRDVWSKFYHKMRVYVIGDAVRPSHIYFSRRPIINSQVTTYKALQRYPPLIRRLMKRTRWHRAAIEEERAFVFGEFEHADLMRRAAEVLNLGYVAIDCARFADGSIVLWEANPHPHLPSWYAGSMRRERNLKGKIVGIWDALQRHLQSLLRAGSLVERHVGTAGH